jgi:hypothetical protein
VAGIAVGDEVILFPQRKLTLSVEWEKVNDE